MKALSFLGQFVLLYVLLVAGTVLVVWLGWLPEFDLHDVSGQMLILFVVVGGVPGVYKIVSERR